jgi:hypothetical protein
MSKWLAAALEAVASLDTERPVAIVPIAPLASDGRPFGTNGTIGTADPESDGGKPPYVGPFAGDLNALLPINPTDSERRWRQACDDARRFLDQWGETAAKLGWTSADLFGLHPIAPLARYDVMGLIWVLDGWRVKVLTRTHAVLDNDLRFRRTSRIV